MGCPMEHTEDFVRRAQRHDEDAFRHLVLTYTAVVAKTTQALLNDRSLAEDAAQEAWLDVWRGLPSLRKGAAFRPWLLPGPDDVAWAAMQRETGTEILAAFKTLSTDHQRILALHYFADLDIGEI